MNIRPIRNEEIPTAAALLADAFLHDPAYEHLIRCSRRRTLFLRRMMALRLRFAAKEKAVWVTEDGLGLISCHPVHSGVSIREFLTLDGLWTALCCNPRDIMRLLRFMGYVSRREAKNLSQTDWIIGPLAVAPAAQGQGYGAALLHYVLEEVVPQGEMAALETQSTKNRDYYRKFGFHILEESLVPGSRVSNIVMARCMA